MFTYFKRLLQQLHREDAGITALETAIILIAFVVVASVFAFTMLSAGTFSTERGKEAVYAGLSEVQSTLEIKGSMLALVTGTVGVSGTVSSLVMTLDVTGGEPVDMTTGTGAKILMEYRDATQRKAIENWTVDLRLDDGDNLLESTELAEITIPLDGLTTALGINTEFAIEVKPPTGAVLNLQRTTPAYLEAVNDLR
jgi:flagellin FlaB